MNIQLLDEFEKEIHAADYEQNVILRMAIEVVEDISVLGYGYLIRDKTVLILFMQGHLLKTKLIYDAMKGDKFVIDCKFRASSCKGNIILHVPFPFP